MTSKIWPPPTAEEEAAAAEVIDNPFQEECDSCGNTECGKCDDCEEPNCECGCDSCEACGLIDCECFEVYVIYSTRVVVTVDKDGDIFRVRVDAELDSPMSVEDEQGEELSSSSPYYERAMEAVNNQSWPSWDIE